MGLWWRKSARGENMVGLLFWKKKWGLDLKESREGFYQKFHCRGLKMEMVWGPTVKSLVQRIRRLRVPDADRNNPRETTGSLTHIT